MKQDYRKDKKTGPSRDRMLKMSDDVLWGIHPVYETLLTDPRRINEVIVLKEKKGGKFEEIIELARESSIKISFVDGLKLTGPDASQVRHQGVAARIVQADLMSLEDLIEKFAAKVAAGEKPVILACDSLQDPHNLGAVIRSAHASGVDAVLITRERSAPLGGIAAKSAAGAMSHIDICQVTNLVTSLKKLKEAGAWVYGAVKDAEAQSIYSMDFNSPTCIVVGSEGQGIRPLVRKECDHTISIPMVGQLDSLNSSVAAGVIMFEILRQKLD